MRAGDRVLIECATGGVGVLAIQMARAGDIEIPDHPLVRQTMHDCLHEALNIDGLIDVLRRIERGEIQLIARDTREPSPFCYELLNSNPYTFLDGGEIPRIAPDNKFQ